MANQLPKSTIAAVTTTVTALFAPFAIPQETIDAGVQDLLDRVCGRGLKSVTDARPLDRVLTMQETAELLHRSRKTVRGLVIRGKLKAVYCGGGQRASGISEASVRDFLAGTTEKEVAA